MAAIRPTEKERERRIGATAELLARGVRKGDICRVIAARFDCSPRSVDRYLRHARANLIAELDEGDTQIHRARSLDVYRSVLRDQEASHHERLNAQTRIDKILGLEHQFTPLTVKHEHQHKVSVKLMEAVRKKPALRNRLMAVLDELPGGFDQ